MNLTSIRAWIAPQRQVRQEQELQQVQTPSALPIAWVATDPEHTVAAADVSDRGCVAAASWHANAALQGAYSALVENPASHVMRRPGVYKPLLTGLGATAAVSGLPTIATLVVDSVALVANTRVCAVGGFLWSQWGATAGVVGTLAGIVFAGEVPTTDAAVQDSAVITGLFAASATFVGRFVEEFRDEPLPNPSFLCYVAQFPMGDVLLIAPAVGVGALLATQGMKFLRSAATPVPAQPTEV